MAKDINRKVTIYVNGKEVQNTIQSIRAEIKKLENAQKKAVLGSEEYIKTTEEISRLKSILNEHNSRVDKLGLSWKDAGTKLSEYANILMGVDTMSSPRGTVPWLILLRFSVSVSPFFLYCVLEIY